MNEASHVWDMAVNRNRTGGVSRAGNLGDMAATGMLIDGVAASEAIDSSGEILDIEGCDISDLEEGRGVLNYEHRGTDAAGASANDIVGKIVAAKKVYKVSDCENDRQKMYWDKVKLPFIYIVARLFDGAGHEGAKAIAAIIRDHKLNNEPILVRYSIEGSTLERDGQRLKRSVAKQVAATIRPCNKTCHSDILEDPNAPQGMEPQIEPEAKDVLDGLVENTKKDEHSHPGYMRLGGHESEYDPCIADNPSDLKSVLKKYAILKVFEKVRKTLTAGNYNAAPGSLTGGAALQREHLSSSAKVLKNRALAALRDYDKPFFRKDEFKSYLKHQLPDASDEFIDHFSDLVGDYQTKRSLLSKKQQPLTPEMNDDVEEAAPEAPEEPEEGPPKPLTIQGQEIKPNPGLKGSHFDEEEGVLHTPRGSIPAFVPSRHSADAGSMFRSAMNDPHVTGFHEYVMDQWSKVHKHFKEGTLPPEVLMHAAAFCYLSPNTAVPVQELMYGHLVDAMHHTGLDPRKPGFEAIGPDWTNRDRPNQPPTHSQEHYADNPAMKIKSKETGSGRVQGDFATFQLPNNHLERIAKYHQFHEFLMDLTKRHKGNAQTAVRELMDVKNQEVNWKSRRRAAIKAGKPDPGEFPTPVPGMMPKIARYMMGMIGGGNVIVPDTHFVRHYFGLDKGTDASTIKYLQQTLWNPKGNGILEGMDRHYLQHHDAVKHMLEDSNWSHVFERPEDALFPAFWKNWAAIIPFEHFMGFKTGGYNEGTTHRPYFESIAPHLKSEPQGVDVNLALQTAKQHADWVSRFGEQTALMMYFRHLLPQLMRRHEEAQLDPVVKMERLSIDLKKTMDDQSSGKIDVQQHVPENFLKHPKQAELVHGVDTGSWQTKAPSHAEQNTASAPFWVKAANGRLAVVKGPDVEFGYGDRPPRAETIYHNVAHSVFGLGHYVPTTVTFRHPRTGEYHSLQESVPGAYHAGFGTDRRIDEGEPAEILAHLGNTGELSKLAVMNVAMGNADRHRGNILFTNQQEPRMQLIDHAFTLNPYTQSGNVVGYDSPQYLRDYARIHTDSKKWRDIPAHPHFLDWLEGLDHTHFHKELMAHGLDSHTADTMASRLRQMKENAIIAKDLFGDDVNLGHILNDSIPAK